MNFDARAAKALSPGAYFTFESYPGLRLWASKKFRTWVYRYRSPVDDGMKQLTIGRWPGMSFPAAIAAWEQLKHSRDQGGDPAMTRRRARLDAVSRKAASKTTAAGIYTVGALCDDYVSGHVDHHRTPKGAAEARRMFDTMLGELAAIDAATVTRAMAFDLIQRFVATAPVQASRLRCELGAAWDFAIDAGRLADTSPNWWRLILRGKIRSKGKYIAGERAGEFKRVLSDAEAGLLIVWLSNYRPTVADVLTIYLWTGTRGAEIVSMTGAEITQEGEQVWWTIPKQKTKNARHKGATDQRVPLFGRGRAVILRRKATHGDGYLFPMRDGKRPIKQKYVQEQVYFHQPYCAFRSAIVRERSPVSHWAPHDLRRTARTMLAKLGCPDAVGESILGHMLPGVLGTYNRHQYDEEKRFWLSRLSDYLESLAYPP